MIDRQNLAATKTFFTHLLDGVTVRGRSQQDWDELEFDGEQPVYLIDGLDRRYEAQRFGQAENNTTIDTRDSRINEAEKLELEKRAYGQSPYTVDLRDSRATPQQELPAQDRSQYVFNTESAVPDNTLDLPHALQSLTSQAVHKLDDAS